MRMPRPLLPFSGILNSKRRMKLRYSFSVQRLPPLPFTKRSGKQASTGKERSCFVPRSVSLTVSTPYMCVAPHHPERSFPLKSGTNPSSIFSG